MNDQVLCYLVTLLVVLFGVWIVLRVDSRRNDQLIQAFVRIKALEDALDDQDQQQARRRPCWNSPVCPCGQCSDVRDYALEQVREALSEERPTPEGLDDWIEIRFSPGGLEKGSL